MNAYTVTVTNVQPSTCLDVEGAVDADVTVTIGDARFAGAVSLAPNKGRPTFRGRHPLDAAGTPLEVWASQGIADALVAADDRSDCDRRDVIGEIWSSVDAEARKAL